MALRIDHHLTARALVPRIERLFDLSAQKILAWKRPGSRPAARRLSR